MYRVGVDALFSCPNRSAHTKGERKKGGCTFCSEQGARAVYGERLQSIEEQIRCGIGFLKSRYKAEKFILYLQAFSNTYASVDELKSIYDYALSCADFSSFVISTRPDVLDKEKAALIAEYKKKPNGEEREVWVELGLQTSNNATLQKIKRGHSAEDFSRARALLKQEDIKCASHIIFGLPGETDKDMLNTIDFLVHEEIEGIKFHDLHILYNTELYRNYLAEGLPLLSVEHYFSLVKESITCLNPETAIMRFSCETPKKYRALPLQQIDKNLFIKRLSSTMKEENLFQGCNYKM